MSKSLFNLDVEYQQVENKGKLRCHDESLYTQYGCSFAGHSLQDCKEKCTANAKKNDRYDKNGPQYKRGKSCSWEECAYVVYSPKKKTCHLANKLCRVEHEAKYEMQVFKKIGKFLY